jgi:pyridoxal biosynthesis lyase PdxS
MENFEINILIDAVKDLRIIRERVNNVNDDEYENLTNAIEKLDEAIELIENGSDG